MLFIYVIFYYDICVKLTLANLCVISHFVDSHSLGLAVWKTGERDIASIEPALKLIHGPCTYLASPNELLVPIRW
jgi:hypothetical protein